MKTDTIDATIEDMGERAFADHVIWRAMLLMQEHGVTFEVMIDRLLTAAGAHIASQTGGEEVVRVFRELADNAAAGAFVSVERRTTANY